MEQNRVEAEEAVVQIVNERQHVQHDAAGLAQRMCIREYRRLIEDVFAGAVVGHELEALRESIVRDDVAIEVHDEAAVSRVHVDRAVTGEAERPVIVGRTCIQRIAAAPRDVVQQRGVERQRLSGEQRSHSFDIAGLRLERLVAELDDRRCRWKLRPKLGNETHHQRMKCH